MDEVFDENKIKHRVYGVLLHNLGFVCSMTSRYEEVASFFKRTIDAAKAATDFDGDELRKRNMELSESNLKTENEVTYDVTVHEPLFHVVFKFAPKVTLPPRRPL